MCPGREGVISPDHAECRIFSRAHLVKVFGAISSLLSRNCARLADRFKRFIPFAKIDSTHRFI
jgi:hypothetical protein